MKLLLTAFDPFGGDSINPALEAVKLVSDHIGDFEIIKLEVPTVFKKSVETVKKEIERVKEIVKEKMENAFKLSVPLIVDINLGKDLYEAK